METIIVKVDTKENQVYLKELLLKFNFVMEVDGESVTLQKELADSKNVAGILNTYADKTKLKEVESVWDKVMKSKHGVH